MVGFEGPTARSLQSVVGALGSDMHAAMGAVKTYAAVQGDAATRLDPLVEQSGQLLDRAIAAASEHESQRARLARWEPIRANRWRALQVAQQDPAADTVSAEQRYYSAARTVDLAAQGATLAEEELNRLEVEWQELRGIEDGIHRDLAANVDAISVPLPTAVTDLIGVDGGSAGWSGGASVADFNWNAILAQYTSDRVVDEAVRQLQSALDEENGPLLAMGLEYIDGVLRRLDEDLRGPVIQALSDEELAKLFSAAEREEVWYAQGQQNDFYGLFAPLSNEDKHRLGNYSGYMAVWATAEQNIGENPAAQQSLADLRSDDAMRTFGIERREAILWQAANYPSERAISNLHRMIGKDWFTDMSFDDAQRSAKLIGYMSEYEDGDRTIIDNTLDHFLDPSSDLRLIWEELDGAAGDSRAAHVFSSIEILTARVRFDRRAVSAGNGSLEDSVNTDDGPLSRKEPEEVAPYLVGAAAHEVNHIVNWIPDANPYEEFMDDYRAEYVAALASTGQPPTYADVVERTAWIIGENSGYPKTASFEGDTTAPQLAEFLSGIISDTYIPPNELVDEFELRDLLIKFGFPASEREVPLPISVNGEANDMTNGSPLHIVDLADLRDLWDLFD